MNLNEFARMVTLKEGKKVSVSIAQVKEIISIIKTEMSTWTDEEIIKFVRKKGKKK